MAGKILIADDTESIRQLLKRFLLPLVSSLSEACSGAELLEAAPREKPDVILLDINMPGSDVLDNLHSLRADPELEETSIILISGSDDPEILDQAFKAGADDFLLKPPNFRQLKARVSAYLAKSELKKVHFAIQGERARNYLDFGKLLESKEPQTRQHLERLKAYCRALAGASDADLKALGLPQDYFEQVAIAGALHDIGKISIPDSVLLKPEALNSEELSIVHGHSERGAELVAGLQKDSQDRGLLALAEEIALAHHEHWDGNGYPRRLQGEDIPLSARIIAICDVYDAVRSERAHRKARSHQEACEIIVQGKGSQFDPDLVDAFCKVESEFAHIFSRSPL